MNQYLEMKKRHQEEVNALPLGFAFSKKQFNEMMSEWGLDPERDTNKIYRLPAGGFIQKKDSPHMHKVFERHNKELSDAIAADQTGEGFIYQMFLAELENHEYGYTCDNTDTLMSLGYTYEDVEKDPRLLHGLRKAQHDILHPHQQSQPQDIGGIQQ